MEPKWYHYKVVYKCGHTEMFYARHGLKKEIKEVQAAAFRRDCDKCREQKEEKHE